MSTSSAESFAKAALSKNKTIDEKVELIAKSLIELAKTHTDQTATPEVWPSASAGF